ncbi:MAG TPA: VCBS repeat-containing protein [Verrucomicrobia bacterium]|nr:VCBS repeat-containing protein [Verrucomicrobiota bacterium]
MENSGKMKSREYCSYLSFCKVNRFRSVRVFLRRRVHLNSFIPGGVFSAAILSDGCPQIRAFAMVVRVGLIVGGMLLVPQICPAQDSDVSGHYLAHFSKRVLTHHYYCDGINAGDINQDGHQDIVAGPFWYEGPSFLMAHEFYPAAVIPTEPSPSNSMFSFVYDFNGDGYPDILVLGRVHKHSAYWYENPGRGSGFWNRHFVFERIRGESPPFQDVDGDGMPELASHWDGQWGFIRPDRTHPKKPWSFTPVTEKGDYNQFYHGTGIGDVNGDGRRDLILNDGWWEQPSKDSPGSLWQSHPFRFGEERGGAQMFADDVDDDGDNDIITSLNAHGWGLAWFEQQRISGQIIFKKHLIMGDRSEEEKFGVAFSQPHALDLVDLNGDGLKDILTGKRMWAHGPTGDVEPNASPVVYWFELKRSADGSIRFLPHRTDDRSGVGVQIIGRDVTGDGRKDILTVSKLGTFLFTNQGEPE